MERKRTILAMFFVCVFAVPQPLMANSCKDVESHFDQYKKEFEVDYLKYTQSYQRLRKTSLFFYKYFLRRDVWKKVGDKPFDRQLIAEEIQRAILAYESYMQNKVRWAIVISGIGAGIAGSIMLTKAMPNLPPILSNILPIITTMGVINFTSSVFDPIRHRMRQMSYRGKMDADLAWGEWYSEISEGANSESKMSALLQQVYANREGLNPLSEREALDSMRYFVFMVEGEFRKAQAMLVNNDPANAAETLAFLARNARVFYRPIPVDNPIILDTIRVVFHNKVNAWKQGEQEGVNIEKLRIQVTQKLYELDSEYGAIKPNIDIIDARADSVALYYNKLLDAWFGNGFSAMPSNPSVKESEHGQ